MNVTEFHKKPFFSSVVSYSLCLFCGFVARHALSILQPHEMDHISERGGLFSKPLQIPLILSQL
jgi:hypothetical protein